MMNLESESGNYWIKPSIDKEPVHVYCNMEIQDGMWTLVYLYTLTNYDNFYTLANAVWALSITLCGSTLVAIL